MKIYDVTKEVSESKSDRKERMAKEQEALDGLFETMGGMNDVLEKILHDKRMKKWRTLKKGVQIG